MMLRRHPSFIVLSRPAMQFNNVLILLSFLEGLKIFLTVAQGVYLLQTVVSSQWLLAAETQLCVCMLT